MRMEGEDIFLFLYFYIFIWGNILRRGLGSRPPPPATPAAPPLYTTHRPTLPTLPTPAALCTTSRRTPHAAHSPASRCLSAWLPAIRHALHAARSTLHALRCLSVRLSACLPVCLCYIDTLSPCHAMRYVSPRCIVLHCNALCP
jgi:hypothetical protein